METRVHEDPKRLNFILGNRDWDVGNSNNRNDARCLQYRKPIIRIEPAKKIAGEKGNIELLNPV
jgi:hypothetical protein